MSRKRRTHSPDFKSKVALAAIKGDDPDITTALTAGWQSSSFEARKYAFNVKTAKKRLG